MRTPEERKPHITVPTTNCVAPGCRIGVEQPHLMCVTHWQSLPRHVRQEVQERLRGWRSIDAAKERIAAYYAAKARMDKAVRA